MQDFFPTMVLQLLCIPTMRMPTTEAEAESCQGSNVPAEAGKRFPKRMKTA